MAWESNQEVPEESGRDWSKVLWLGVGLAVVVMLAVLFKPEARRADKSQVRLRHLLITVSDTASVADAEAALTQIVGLRERVLDGEDFGKLAREYSGDEASATRGGDLGWVSHGELADPIEEFMWTAPLDQVSDIIETSYGFHLVLVTDREIADAEKYERELHERVLEESYSGDKQ